LFFSILIPTCNRSKLLEICLNSLFRSVGEFAKEELEVIVTDDGFGNEAKILVESHYPWVKWIEGPKKGPAANRNNAAKLAIGKWLIFLDDDCVPGKFLVTSYYKYITRHPAVQVFEGSIQPDGPPYTPLDYAPINIIGGKLWSCNFCIKKSLFENLQGFDEAFKFPHLEDVDLNMRIINKNIDILFCKDALVVHPWRKFDDGKKLARYNEMDFYLAKKHNKPVHIHKILFAIINVHLAMFKRNPNSKYFFSALKIGVDHSMYFLLFSLRWKKKYFS